MTMMSCSLFPVKSKLLYSNCIALTPQNFLTILKSMDAFLSDSFYLLILVLDLPIAGTKISKCLTLCFFSLSLFCEQFQLHIVPPTLTSTSSFLTLSVHLIPRTPHSIGFNPISFSSLWFWDRAIKLISSICRWSVGYLACKLHHSYSLGWWPFSCACAKHNKDNPLTYLDDWWPICINSFL